MRGIAGVFWRDGRPAAAAALDAALAHLGHRGKPDVERGDTLALATLGAAPARGEARLPVAFHGRLDNADALMARLDLDAPHDARAIVAAAYERWGVDFADHLLGDFALALWDDARRTLVCARDPLGLCPFFYHLGPDVFVFASEARAVLAHPSVSRRIDEGMVAETLSVNVESLTATLYRDIRRLPPGQRLEIGPERARRVAWWTPSGRPVGTPRPEPWYGAFRETFDRAVADRLGHEPIVGTHLSGGFDSTAVATTACRYRRDGQVLEAFSNVYPGRDCDERPYIEAVAAATGLRVTQVPEAPFERDWFLESAAARLDLPPFPGDAASRALRAAARARGVGVLLTGYGGDEVTHPTVNQGAEYVRRGRWREAVAALRTPRRGTSAEVLRATIVGSLPPRLARRLRRRGSPTVPPWIDASFAASVRLDERLREPPQPPRTPGKHELVRRLVAGWNVRGLEAEEQTAAWEGFEQRHPFLDRRVVELALAMPEWVRTRPGEVRPLLVHGLGTRIPPLVRARRDKAAFDHLLLRGLQALGAHEAWPELAIARRGWVDGAVARAMHADYRAEVERTGLPGAHGFALWSILAVDVWYRAVRDG